MNYQCLILCLLLLLLPSCARKPAVDQPMHQFLYSVQNTDEALQKLGEDSLDLAIAYDEKHDRAAALAGIEKLEDEWRSLNSDCKAFKAPAGGEELVSASQLRCELVGKELVAMKAYLQGINPQENLKNYKAFAMRLAGDFKYPGTLRTLAKKANVELSKDKKIPKP